MFILIFFLSLPNLAIVLPCESTTIEVSFTNISCVICFQLCDETPKKIPNSNIKTITIIIIIFLIFLFALFFLFVLVVLFPFLPFFLDSCFSFCLFSFLNFFIALGTSSSLFLFLNNNITILIFNCPKYIIFLIIFTILML